MSVAIFAALFTFNHNCPPFPVPCFPPLPPVADRMRKQARLPALRRKHFRNEITVYNHSVLHRIAPELPHQ
jgi:hypothetical protein